MGWNQGLLLYGGDGGQDGEGKKMGETDILGCNGPSGTAHEVQ